MTQDAADLEIARKARAEAVALAGGPVSLADKLGIKHPSICNWDVVPPRRVIAVERLTGVPRWRLRPDIYPEVMGVTSATAHLCSGVDAVP